jgi:hypothetical protein
VTPLEKPKPDAISSTAPRLRDFTRVELMKSW